jgi:ribonuclease P protein component
MQKDHSQPGQTFRKRERLCSKTRIKALFEKSNSINAYPLKLLWKKAEEMPNQPPLKLVISVPKRNIKSAVMRNKIKRRMREAYRKNRHLLFQSDSHKNLQCDAVFIYTGKVEMPYKEVEAKIIQLLNRLNIEYEKANG